MSFLAVLQGVAGRHRPTDPVVPCGRRGRADTSSTRPELHTAGGASGCAALQLCCGCPRNVGGVGVQVASTDRAVRLYDFATGQPRGPAGGLRAHGELVTGLGWGGDGLTLLTVGADGCIFSWVLPATGSVGRVITNKLTARRARQQLQLAKPPPPIAPSSAVAAAAVVPPLPLEKLLDTSAASAAAAAVVVASAVAQPPGMKFSKTLQPGERKLVINFPLPFLACHCLAFPCVATALSFLALPLPCLSLRCHCLSLRCHCPSLTFPLHFLALRLPFSGFQCLKRCAVSQQRGRPTRRSVSPGTRHQHCNGPIVVCELVVLIREWRGERTLPAHHS